MGEWDWSNFVCNISLLNKDLHKSSRRDSSKKELDIKKDFEIISAN